MKVTGILLLAGNSTRYNKSINKNFELINSQHVFLYSLNIFDTNDLINDIILVIREDDQKIVESILNKLKFHKKIKLVIGGKTRMESSYNAINNTSSDIVVIHDAARPLIKNIYITNVIKAIDNYVGAITSVKVKDTIKIANTLGEIIASTNRENTYIGQTPQAFDRKILLKFHEKYKNDLSITDDAMLLEKENYPLKIVNGDYTNIKITTQEDLLIVKEFMKNNI